MRSASAVAIALLATLSLVAPCAVPVAADTPAPSVPADGSAERVRDGVSETFVRDSSEGSAVHADSDGQATGVQSDGLEPADPKTIIAIRLQADGDAVWTIQTRFRVNDSNETAAFEELVQNVRSGRAEVGYSRALFQEFANASAAATGREMTIRDPRWSGDVADGVGTLSYRFTWTNFSEKRGNWVNVTETFNGTDGTWFPALEDGQRLVIYPPEGYAVKGSPPDKGPRLSDGALVWEGPRTFEPGYLQAKYIEQAGGPTTDPGPGTSDPDVLLILLGAGLLVLIVSVGAGGYFLARQQDEGEGGDAPAAGAASDPAPNGGATAASDGDAASDGEPATPAEPSVEGEAADGVAAEDADDAGAAAGAAASEAEEDEADEVNVELLSDEERVERLLTQNGGRMKQANIVKETGWSNAKVSQLLSAMDEADRIDKLRIGRENLITLPDEDVTDV